MAVKKSDLYSSLWALCDELRGGIDASQYKDYVLFMLFIKYVSDKYGDSDDLEPPITIPKGASFNDMAALTGNPNIGDLINTQVIQRLVDANEMLARTDFPDFNDPNKLGEGNDRVDRLGRLISIFSSPDLNFAKNRADHDDILGDAYEYLMRHFATESEIRLTLIHCKYASNGKVSGQIANFYEVCGQAQKSIVVKHEGLPKLATSLRKRHEKWAKQGASRVLKGDLKKLSYFVEKSRKAKLSFGVVIVQPSVSDATYTPAMAKLLANTELFLKRTTEAKFRFIGS
ncbi:type I restriction-modification system subunit M N-terminal domain-containing protein [uncultured Roseobacter sp.]|uniref:type I restriction-modification system subunit M N-terminal domain-containing protein n=1 Tax=uncultured Roseobacter sp. TaxID=114847 RepID=UPI0026120FF8|nr:type I restriction-modification system subunit M N-terminal domain-containing protein [uncultured Roseobacter sp.]